MKRILLSLLTFATLMLLNLTTLAQTKYDTLVYNSDSTKVTKMMAYPVKDRILLYQKPKPFSFITKLPRTFSGAAKEAFSKKSIPAWSVIAGSTVALIIFDQKITDGVQQFSNYIGVDSEKKYKTLISFHMGSTKVNAYEFPKNLNSVLYTMGEGSTTMLLCGGFSVYGRIKNDYRARSTSSQIFQSQLALGVMCQILKRVTGRESPSGSTNPGGTWRPFTNPADYQKEVSHHDAFPSGHLATMMATLVVVSANYPDKKWIKPVGYSLMGLTSLAMINNGVHWAGDYPLALGIGYVCGKVAVKMNRIIKEKTRRR